VPVVDASIVVDWVAPDADLDGPAQRLLGRLVQSKATLLAPHLLFEEVANALLTGVRRTRWSGEDADEAFGLLRRLPVSLVDDERDLARAWELARRYDAHPVYDMLYAAVALRRSELLLTADARLQRRLAATGIAVAADDYP
jgi:predicted nucleic acid-binding protein